jgi:predicted nucleotidyltransferase
LKPSIALEKNRNAIREAVKRNHLVNVRVFGSVLHGTDREGSDLDLLVDALPGVTLFDIGGLQADLEEMLSISVDIRTPNDLPIKFRNQVLLEAEPV